MADVEIVNPVPLAEMAGWFDAMFTTYLMDPAGREDQESGRVAAWEPSRAWGARADRRWIATLRTMPRTLTIPGTSEALPADALTNVTVAATHRRRGLLSAMLTQSLDAAKERGDAVSILVAAEWPIYGRYGYAPATDATHYTVFTRLPGARMERAATGSCRQVNGAELGDLAPELFATSTLLRAGNINRPQDWWNRDLGLNGVVRSNKDPVVHIVHEGPNGVDGYVSWTPVSDWHVTDELAQVKVQHLVATDEQAYVSLWQYLLGIDIVDQIHLRDRPVDESLRWLLADGRAIRPTYRGDFVWLRILDVPTALASRRYATEGHLTVEIIDPDGAGYTAGRYLLDGGPAAAQCTRTKQDVDLRLTQRALAAAYLGGFSLASQRILGAVEELRPGALARADAMFATPSAPWCATAF